MFVKMTIMLVSFAPYLEPKETYYSMNNILGIEECEDSISSEKIIYF